MFRETRPGSFWYLIIFLESHHVCFKILGEAASKLQGVECVCIEGSPLQCLGWTTFSYVRRTMASKLWRILKRSRPKVPVESGIVAKETAKQRVLSNYELLEAILLSLPSLDLRNARFVAQDWNGIITRPASLNTEWQWFERAQMRVMKICLFRDHNVGKLSLIRKASHQNVLFSLSSYYSSAK